ncbi:MAG: RNA ligase RtcB family protein [Synergistaceae bacterium]|jgi:release factor H-coupled RctB family protein|nr:RNA ligase RtcB family protein [Synergistaceae bacterium]
MEDKLNEKITIIANEKCWIEQPAVRQLETVSSLPGVVRAVGLPDLHVGRSPVGVVLETEGIIYPHLVGNDIGCGMGLFETSCRVKKYRQDRFFSRLNEIEALRDVKTDNPFPEESPIIDLGTIGGGNHFAEFQSVRKIYDEGLFKTLGIDRSRVMLLVHSGSRRYGEQIYSEFSDFGGLAADGERARLYMTAHDNAILWAERNRLMIAKKLTDYLGYASELKAAIDCGHNYIQRLDGRFLHRKGALSAKKGPVIIPGSRGALTYVVVPSENTALSMDSLSHGAGRKWIRSLCKGRLRDKYDRYTIRETKLKSVTVCHDINLLYEEAPEAYKSIDHIIDALVESGLCEVIATLQPLLTFKA